MELFKFRSMAMADRTLELVMSGVLHCSFYKDLNDPFEGLFYAISHESGIARGVARPIARAIARPIASGRGIKREKSVESQFVDDQCVRICSLSSDSTDVRLWGHYADSLAGIAIGFDFSAHSNDVVQVKYTQRLPVVALSDLQAMRAKDLLSIKTDHWSYESEYRIIQTDAKYNASGRMTRILLGARISDIHRQLILRLAPEGVPVFETALDRQGVRVVPNTQRLAI